MQPIATDVYDQLQLTTADLTATEKQELLGDGAKESNYFFYEAQDPKLAKKLLHIDNSEEIAAYQNEGFQVTNEEVYIIEEKISSRAAKPNTKIVITTLTGNSEKTKLNDNKFGMKHWLNVGFSLLLDSTSSHLAIAAEILGINASDFLPKWKDGDFLEKSESRVRKEKWVQVQTKTGSYHNAGRGVKEDITVYIDLRTFKEVNGELEPVRESSSTKITNITKNYNNHSKLTDLTIKNTVVGDLIVSFYEDPWQ